MYSVTRTVTGGTSNTWRETHASVRTVGQPNAAVRAGLWEHLHRLIWVVHPRQPRPGRPWLLTPATFRPLAGLPRRRLAPRQVVCRRGASRSCRCYDRRAVPARPPAPPAGHSPKPALRSPRRGTRTKRIPAWAAASRTPTTNDQESSAEINTPRRGGPPATGRRQPVSARR